MLLSKSCIDKLRSESKLPVECIIDTKGSALTIWIRPIQSLKDRKGVEILQKDREA